MNKKPVFISLFVSMWLLTGLPATTQAQVCGDGIQDAGEECDDGNTSPGDGCGPDCQRESCETHWDCPQEWFCYKEECFRDTKMTVYHCDKPGCPPGQTCYDQEGVRSVCAEDETYVCETACDCGYAHACFEIPGVGKRCVKDKTDPYNEGGIVIFEDLIPSTFPEGEPTYCCAQPMCYAGSLSYSNQNRSFLCYDASIGGTSELCGSKQCFFTGDCSPGESCVDVRWESTAAAGASCSPEGGRCVANAIAEATFEYKPGELLQPCADQPSGTLCERGWRPGGVYAVSRVLGTAGSCGNGACDPGEYPDTCAEDCSCGDGVCAPVELGNCEADCGTCGDGTCDSLETPKWCPSDCSPVECGDGSCNPVEVESCDQDCGCPDSATYVDLPLVCGDGVCQNYGDIPEDCKNCPQDCDAVNDSDGDGTPDGCDGCPNDPAKTETGVCGCGVPDTDSDEDGLADCEDPCPQDPLNDDDSDSICGAVDRCPGTVLPESVPMSGSLSFNRWALTDNDGVFDTNRPPGGGTSASFTLEDTAGCSCEQIVKALGLGKNHLKNGCSTSSMTQWVEMVSNP